MNRGDELTLKLDAFAFEGKSVARFEGMVVFVHGGVPGDEVRARIVKVKKQFAEAQAMEILTPSALRVQPRCRYFGTCGGCKWQDVHYQAQLDFKRQHVIDALERIGGFGDVQVNPALGSIDIYCYRNKMEFSFGERWLSNEEMTASGTEGTIDRFALGLHIPQRYDRVLDLEECWLQSQKSSRIVNEVRSFCRRNNLAIFSTDTHSGYLRNLIIREAKQTNELMVNLVTRDDVPSLMTELTGTLLSAVPSITTIINNITDRKSQVAIGDIEKVYHGTGYITEKIGKRTYRISANSFFQTNTLQAEQLYITAQRMATLKPDDVLFDLYSGTGTIALHVADDVAEVVGIESIEAAVKDAQRNAEQNGVNNCRFLLGDLKDRLTKDTGWLQQHPKPTVMIIDPPRSGMHEKVVMEVKAILPERIVYVSCNPTTQARDLKLLCAEGAYTITGVQPVDMFPHTYHIENVVSLRTTRPSQVSQ